jgi:hypothetical protein
MHVALAVACHYTASATEIPTARLRLHPSSLMTTHRIFSMPDLQRPRPLADVNTQDAREGPAPTSSMSSWRRGTFNLRYGSLDHFQTLSSTACEQC